MLWRTRDGGWSEEPAGRSFPPIGEPEGDKPARLGSEEGGERRDSGREVP